MKKYLLTVVVVVSVAVSVSAQNGGPWDIGAANLYGKDRALILKELASVKATLNKGTLTIKGTGAMLDFALDGDESVVSPWAGSTSITNIVIENGVTSIGGSIFAGCANLVSITIPNSVASIRDDAFMGCTGLKTITILNPAPPAFQNAFFGINMANVCLYVPSSAIEAYRSADGWKTFSCIKEVASK